MEFEAVPFAELLLRGAARHPERDCMVLPGGRLTYGQLAERATDAGRSLLAMGVDRGAHVGIIMANSLDYVEILFGASLIGAVPVLYNGRFKAREIAHVTADAGVVVVVTSDIVEEHTDYVRLLERALPDDDQRPDLVLLGAGTVPGFTDRQAFRTLADNVDPVEVERRHRRTELTDTAIMFYTSGTTAMPKGCPLDHIVLQHAGVIGGVERWGLEEGDTMWGPLPMFHTAFTQPLTGVLHLGGTYLSMTHFEPAAALAMIRKERPTAMFPAFPTITKALLNHPDYRPELLASVRTVLNVGPPDVLRSMEAQMPSTTTQLTAFGMTETGGSVAMCERSDSVALRSETSGRALPGNEIRVVDPVMGLDVGPGERGEIVARGRGVFSGYHNDPIKTAEAIDAEGWFHTGDLGSLDADGRVTFHGRLKDMLKVGGENVAAVEVEGFLATHPAVNLAQVVGLPDEKYEEVPVAFIELLPQATASEAEIIDFCEGEIAAFKVPRHVRFVDDWPMGATKILKYELRDRICAELGVGLGEPGDKAAVVDVAIRYCELIDGGRWSELDQVFVPDAIFHLPDGDYVGLEAIRSRISEALGPLDNSQHMVSNHQVTIGAGEAGHRCYFQAQHVRSGPPDGPTYTVAGRYQDRLIRTDAGWRIVERTLTVMWTAGNERVLRP